MIINILIVASLIVSLVMLMWWYDHCVDGGSTEELKTGSLTNKLVIGFVGVSIVASMVLIAYTEFIDIEPNDVVGVVDRYKIVMHYSNAVRVVTGEGECSATGIFPYRDLKRSTRVRKGTVEVVEIKKGILSWNEIFINDADVMDKQ